MEPSEKSEQVEEMLKKTFGFDRRDYIRIDRCVPKPMGCGKSAMVFREEINIREYRISGLCQECQDRILKDVNV